MNSCGPSDLPSLLAPHLSNNYRKNICVGNGITLCIMHIIITLRPDFTPNLVHGLAIGTPKFYMVPYGKINHGLVYMSSNCDMKLGLRGGSIDM